MQEILGPHDGKDRDLEHGRLDSHDLRSQEVGLGQLQCQFLLGREIVRGGGEEVIEWPR